MLWYQEKRYNEKVYLTQAQDGIDTKKGYKTPIKVSG